MANKFLWRGLDGRKKGGWRREEERQADRQKGLRKIGYKHAKEGHAMYSAKKQGFRLEVCLQNISANADIQWIDRQKSSFNAELVNS